MDADDNVQAGDSLNAVIPMIDLDHDDRGHDDNYVPT